MAVGSLCCACTKEEVTHDELVVEGWICQDSHPIVLIHQSFAINDPKHGEISEDANLEDIMGQQMIVWGRVAISDGTQEIVLTGRLDTLYTPPFVYTSTHIRGEVGKTYKVTVDYEDYHATAYSTIQEPIGLDSLAIRLERQSGTTHIIAYLSHVPNDSYFLAEYRTTFDHQYTICPMGTATYAQARDGVISMNILSQDTVSNSMTSALHHFRTDDNEYILRLIHINKEQYDYFSALVSQLATQGMYFMPVYKNISSNIDGGIGYWAGFGKEDYHFFINRDTTYRY